MQLGFDLASAAAFDLEGLSDRERAVVLALRWDKERARPVPEIAAEAGLSGRNVQKIVNRLILEHHVPIGTTMTEPCGNYLIRDPEDLAHTVNLLRSRALHQLERAAALRKMPVRRLLAELQTELLLEGGQR